MNEKVKIIVFVSNTSDQDKYMKLFWFMLKDKLVRVMNSRGYKKLETGDFVIQILIGNESARGHRAHYVLNLTQGLEFENCVARPIERFEYLDKLLDPKFKELF